MAPTPAGGELPAAEGNEHNSPQPPPATPRHQGCPAQLTAPKRRTATPTKELEIPEHGSDKMAADTRTRGAAALTAELPPSPEADDGETPQSPTTRDPEPSARTPLPLAPQPHVEATGGKGAKPGDSPAGSSPSPAPSPEQGAPQLWLTSLADGTTTPPHNPSQHGREDIPAEGGITPVLNQQVQEEAAPIPSDEAREEDPPAPLQTSKVSARVPSAQVTHGPPEIILSGSRTPGVTEPLHTHPIRQYSGLEASPPTISHKMGTTTGEANPIPHSQALFDSQDWEDLPDAQGDHSGPSGEKTGPRTNPALLVEETSGANTEGGPATSLFSITDSQMLAGCSHTEPERLPNNTSRKDPLAPPLPQRARTRAPRNPFRSPSPHSNKRETNNTPGIFVDPPRLTRVRNFSRSPSPRSLTTSPGDEGSPVLKMRKKSDSPWDSPQSHASSHDHHGTPVYKLYDSRDLKRLLRNVATKEDVDSIALRVEKSLRKEVDNVQQQVATLDNRMGEFDSFKEDCTRNFSELRNSQASFQRQVLELQLQQDDTENRSRRNNVKVRGIPESIATSALKDTLTDIFNSLLNNPPGSEIEIDRAHRINSRPNTDPQAPRDILCRIHFFTMKEKISKAAWERKDFIWKGNKIQILPDLSRRTLRMRAALRPLLSKIQEAGATYRWGYPFHLIIKKGPTSFLLHTPEDLPRLFEFLGCRPVDLPNWLTPDLPQPQRGRGRQRQGPAPRRPPRNEDRPQ